MRSVPYIQLTDTGLLDLYETGFDEMWLQWAVQLQETQDKLFWDKENGGYFSGQASERILLNLKEGACDAYALT